MRRARRPKPYKLIESEPLRHEVERRLALRWCPPADLLEARGDYQAALQEQRHLRGDRVLYRDDGEPADKWCVKWALDVAERRASLRRGTRLHILRHTFCSRLAARNVPMLTIKELAGHRSLETTMRYMHLSEAAPRAGIRALEARGTSGAPEQSGETKSSSDA